MLRIKTLFACCIAPTLLIVVGCSRTSTVSDTLSSATTAPKIASTAIFQNVATRSGLNFTHYLGASGKFYFDETTPAGCALFDFDGDGNQDVFLVQSGSSAPVGTVKNRPLCALYRNQGDGTFKDVSRGSGLDKDLGYAQGVAVGDFDGDGFDDLFITAFGSNHLFHNRKGTGKFEDVTAKMGLNKIHDTGYATSAAWGDYDGDGRLDLYVCYYAHWNHQLNRHCTDSHSILDYCNPQVYEPSTHILFHNLGNTFKDVSDQTGISSARGRGLSAAFMDYNNDGKPDIFVANDVTPNMLWKNNGNGTFSNTAQQAGCAYDGQGQDMASMGIGIADYNRTGRPSLYISNFSNLPNILFQNVGNGLFQDVTREAQLSFSHLKFLSFGCEFVDYDADGWPDIITNNGHVQMSASHLTGGTALKQRKQLLRNTGNGRFSEITDPALLGDLSTPVVGRGLATGDFDNDGRVDVLAMSQNGPVQLLRNQTRGNGNHFVSFLLRGTQSNRDAIGARVEVQAGAARQTAWVQGGSSFLSSSDRRLYFGLGKNAKIESLSVAWPSGQKETLRDLQGDTFYTLTEGKGITAKHTPRKPNSP